MRIKDWIWIITYALLIMAVNVGISVLYMVVYGHLLNPGQPASHYQEHVQIAAPYSSIIAGAPLFYLAGRFLTRRWPTTLRVRAALLVALIYALIDIALLAATGVQLRLLIFVVISIATKFLAAFLGGNAATTSKP